MRAIRLPSLRWSKLRPRTAYRVLEMLPGICVWLTFVAAVLASFFLPVWAITFIIIFDLYWFIRAVYVMVYLLVAYRRLRESLSVDWQQQLDVDRLSWQDIFHLVVVPTYKEPYEVIEQSFEGLAAVRYPKEKLFVVFAGEERDRVNVETYARRIQEKFGATFGELLVTFHPANLPGEVPGKGANINWAGHRAVERIDERRIPHERVIVTTLDVDTVVHPQYFSHLTHVFLNHPTPLRTSYQPIPFYHNNVWTSSALTRVVASSTTFWLMTETVRPDRLFTFSSHSMPLKALIDVGFWQSDIVTEDSRIFLQCFMEYDGDYRVTPLYIPISMDTVSTPSLRRTIINQYKQQRRWAYGVENFPWMVWNFSANPNIPFQKKAKYIWNQVEGVYSWATAPIIIFLLGWVPVRVAAFQDNPPTLVYSAPAVLQFLMLIAMIGLVVAAILSTVLLPRPWSGRSRFRIIPMLLQWLLFPITMVVFGSIPAADAQTRLMLGRYLGFWVTEKSRPSKTA